MAKAKKKSLDKPDGVQQEIDSRLTYEISNREGRRQRILADLQKGVALEQIVGDMHQNVKYDTLGRQCAHLRKLCDETADKAGGAWDLQKVIDIFLEYRYRQLQSILGNYYTCNCTSMMVNAANMAMQAATLEGIEFAEMMLGLLRPFDTEGKITILKP